MVLGRKLAIEYEVRIEFVSSAINRVEHYPQLKPPLEETFVLSNKDKGRKQAL